MIGIGVGIDYALFIVTRYRQGIFEGRDPRDAVVASLMTSGRSVLFAGSTVVISLFGLYLIGQPYMIGLATACIAAVLMVLVAALTLLPALWASPARPSTSCTSRACCRPAGHRRTNGFWYRWSRFVQRRAWVTGTLAVLVLLLLAIPFFSMRLAFTDAGNDPTVAHHRARPTTSWPQGFGPGFNGPLVVAVTIPEAGGRPARSTHLRGRHRRHPGVASRRPAQFNADRHRRGHRRHTPPRRRSRPQTQTLVRVLRTDVIPPVVGGTGVDAQVGGQTAAGIDAASFLGHRLFLVIGAVLVALVPAAHDGVPLRGAAAQGGDHEPAVVGRGLRRDGGRLPVGLAGQRHRHRQDRPDRPLDPGEHVRHPLRALHGLRGVPAVPHPGGVAAHGRQLALGGRRAGRDRPHHHRGRRHHVLRLRLVRASRIRCTSSRCSASAWPRRCWSTRPWCA